MEKKALKRKTGICLMIGGLLIFAVAACSVAGGGELAFDATIQKAVYSLRTDGLTVIAKIITCMGNKETIIALCLVLLMIPATRARWGVPVSGAALLVTILNRIVKLIFARPRPDEHLRLIAESGFSFTSGHAITSMVVYGLLIWLVRKYVRKKKTANILTVLLAIPWIFIGLSRIYMGVHYPTDVLGGWGLGLAILMAVIMAEDAWSARRQED